MAKPKPIREVTADVDNLYPSEGSYFSPREPEEQRREREREESLVESAEPIIKKVIKHLDARIAFRDKIDSIGVDIEDSPELHQKMMHVNQLLKAELEVERSYLIDILDTYKKR